jgi:hypothetical protein
MPARVEKERGGVMRRYSANPHLRKPSAEWRKSSAESAIRSLSSEIAYHDAEASRLRKERQKEKGKLDRAEAAIEKGKP